MPIITQIICDGCGAVKQEVNHWYAITVTGESALLKPLDRLSENQCIAEATGDQQVFCGRLW